MDVFNGKIKNFSLYIKNLGEMADFAEKFLNRLFKFDKNKALVVALKGNLGSGKTTFTRLFGELLGIKERITSPTFVLMHEHDLEDDIKKQLGKSKFIHIDCYRTAPKHILDLGLKDLLNDKNNLIVIEWADKVSKFLRNAIWLEFKTKGENEREIKIQIT